MTREEAQILAKIRRGDHVTQYDKVAAMYTLGELRTYRAGLSATGALTTEARDAIRDRQDQIRAGRG